MQIIHITERHELRDGGLTTSVNALVELAIDLGHEVAVFTSGDHPLVPKKAHHYRHEVSRVGKPWLWSRSLSSELAATIRKFEPDVIHVHGCWMAPQIKSFEIARELAIPTIVSFHNFLSPWLWHNQGKISRIKKSLYWHVLAKPKFEGATLCHAITPLEKQRLAEFLPASRIEVIPNFIDDEIGKEISSSSGVCVSDPVPIVLFLGRIAPVKGLDVLIDGFAISLLRERWKLIIAGPSEDVSLEAHLRQKIHRLGLDRNVDMIGAVAGVEKWRLLKQAWVLCAPSYTEVVGMVNLEAAICGTPTMTTKETGLFEWDSHGGITVSPTSNDVARALNRAALWTTDERAQNAARLRRHVINTYSRKVVGGRWDRVYREVAHAHNHKHNYRD